MENAGIIFFQKGNVLWDMSCGIFTWMDISSGPNKKSDFWAKLFLGALFYQGQIYIFEISIK